MTNLLQWHGLGASCCSLSLHTNRKQPRSVGIHVRCPLSNSTALLLADTQVLDILQETPVGTQNVIMLTFTAVAHLRLLVIGGLQCGQSQLSSVLVIMQAASNMQSQHQCRLNVTACLTTDESLPATAARLPLRNR